MSDMKAPDCFRHAREEVLLALSAPNEMDECEHRKRASGYIAQAVQDIAVSPEQQWDWSSLCPGQQE
ncbi:MAG: hypothetical protein KDE63_00715 [Novosphingobium sp.]|nr:hypothetical protein [Novosphingobium sp.]